MTIFFFSLVIYYSVWISRLSKGDQFFSACGHTSILCVFVCAYVHVHTHVHMCVHGRKMYLFTYIC